MYSLYTLVYLCAITVLLPFEYLKRPRGIRRRWFREKNGSIQGSTGSSCIWIHAVSVGEVIASVPLIRRLKSAYPSKRVVVSTITDTGQKVARQNLPGDVLIVYLPFDIPSALHRAVGVLKPELLIIMETELWPNLIRIFSGSRIPVILLNGRISENSFHGYKKISFFLKMLLPRISFFGMQGEEYARRIMELGAPADKVAAIGNFKFDAKPAGPPPSWTDIVHSPVIVAGSTHEGEEEMLADVLQKLLPDFPGLNMIIAPRHPERFEMVGKMLSGKGRPFIRRTEIGSKEATGVSGTMILLDSVGELPSVYGKADIAIVGKSFKGKGGQNPFEAASWSKPVLCGPHMENFPVAAELFASGGAIEVEEGQLHNVLKELLSDPEKAREMGEKARLVYENNTGAVEKAMKVIERYLK
jgi:3-deoxy-D-manno-octulosonic-acid transferase